ncbi:aspartate carbamoyltransferase (plasmid) [Clostridium perfringens]
MKNRELQNHKCKNTKCITQVEKYVPQSFTLIDKKNNTY